LSIEAAVGPMEVVVVLPVFEFLVEPVGVLDDDAVARVHADQVRSDGETMTDWVAQHNA
jgi:hypothetical protein